MAQASQCRLHRPLAIIVAAGVDLLTTEPPNAVHPVAWLGRGIGLLTAMTPAGGPGAQLLWGGAMAAGVPAAAATVGRLIGQRAECLLPPLALAVEGVALKPAFAVRALLAAAGRVEEKLAIGDLPAARRAVAQIVSRETATLDGAQVAAAAIESLAENLTDSTVAPLLAYALAGLPAAYAYRAVNTLDAMVGYRGRYEYLGKAAARLDDAANLLPARLAALLIAIAAPAGGGSVSGALAVARRHHRRTASPNAGWSMAAMAGALGVTLEKAGHYRLGDGQPPAPADIRRAQRIVAGAAGLAVGVTALIGGSRRR